MVLLEVYFNQHYTRRLLVQISSCNGKTRWKEKRSKQIYLQPNTAVFLPLVIFNTLYPEKTKKKSKIVG